VRGLRHKLQEISTAASIAAQALDACACDWLAPELGRMLGALDGIAERLTAVCDRLSAGIDPQRGGPPPNENQAHSACGQASEELPARS
jgi:hypothetical protein